MEYNLLIEKSKIALKKARPTYSNFYVGAALLAENGDIILGCNIETASYSLTICAERCAIFKAISEGYTKFKAIAIASSSDDFCPPCGACREVIMDLCGNIDVVLSNSKNEIKIFKMNELLPFNFGSDFLKK